MGWRMEKTVRFNTSGIINFMEQEKRLVLIDGHAMLYRAWFAFPQSLTTRDGRLINAVYGFTRTLLTVIQDMHPEYLVVSFDVGRTFRHDMYKEYKAHREKMPEELKEQEPITYRMVETLNVPVFTKEGFEADDVIGTLAAQASEITLPASPLIKGEEKGGVLQTIIVTGDKDTLQLVDDQGLVRVYMPGRGAKGPVLYNEAAVVNDLGVTAKQIPDYKGLAGDSSDNIPGVRGVGPKTAVTLLKEFGSLEGIYQYLEGSISYTVSRISETARAKILTSGVINKLKAGKQSAFESKKLATIVTDVPIRLDLNAAEVKEYDKGKVVDLFEELEFRSLLSKLPNDSFEAAVQEALF